MFMKGERQEFSRAEERKRGGELKKEIHKDFLSFYSLVPPSGGVCNCSSSFFAENNNGFF